MTGDEIPKARRTPAAVFRLIWMVPAMAGRGRAYLVFHRLQDTGRRSPELTDGGGLRVGQTPLRYRACRWAR